MQCKICSVTTEIECPECLRPVCPGHVSSHNCSLSKRSFIEFEDEEFSSVLDEDQVSTSEDSEEVDYSLLTEDYKEDYKIESKNPKKQKTNAHNIKNNSSGSISEIEKKNKLSSDSCHSCRITFGMEASANQCPNCGKKFCNEHYREHKNVNCSPKQNVSSQTTLTPSYNKGFNSQFGLSKPPAKESNKIFITFNQSGLNHSTLLNTVNNNLLDIGIVTFNIHDFKAEDKKEKNAVFNYLLERHPWLDVVALQEFRWGHRELINLGEGIGIAYGPPMLSISPGADIGRIRLGQNELYPIIFRTKTVKVKASWATYDGNQKLAPNTGNPDFEKINNLTDKRLKGPEKQSYAYKLFEEDKLVLWSKEEHNAGWDFKGKQGNRPTLYTCRPIVVYNLEVEGKQVYVAVVHTTPEGTKLDREGEYRQVKSFFEYVSNQGGYWIIIGDYYLDPESSVESNTGTSSRQHEDLFKTNLGNLGLEFAIPISATNQTKLQQKTGALQHHDTLMSQFGDREKGIEVTEKNREEEKYKRYIKEGKKGYKDRVLRKRGSKKFMVVNKRADFIVCTQNFQFRQAGLIRPSGGLLVVDPNHHALNWWSQFSDHCPSGAILCSASSSKRWSLYQSFLQQYWPEIGKKLMEAEIQIQELRKNAAVQIKKCWEELERFVLSLSSDFLEDVPLLILKLTNQLFALMYHAWEICYLNQTYQDNMVSDDMLSNGTPAIFGNLNNVKVVVESSKRNCIRINKNPRIKNVFDLLDLCANIEDLDEFAEKLCDISKNHSHYNGKNTMLIIEVLYDIGRAVNPWLNKLDYVVADVDIQDEQESYDNINLLEMES